MNHFRKLEEGMGSVVPGKRSLAPVVRKHKGWSIVELEDGLFATRSPDGWTLSHRYLSPEDAIEGLELRWAQAAPRRVEFNNAAKNNRHFRQRRSS